MLRAFITGMLFILGQFSMAGMMDDLTLPPKGKIVHFSSSDPHELNHDYYSLAPGGSITLMQMNGPGIVRHLWMCVGATPGPEVWRGLILRIYWDGEKSPSVEAPVGDFAGASLAQPIDYTSLPMDLTDKGAFNCWFPMPFHKSAKIVLTDESPTVKVDLFYNIDAERLPSLPKDTLYFHAQYRRENPTTFGKDYTILEAKGRGKLVGVHMNCQSLCGHWPLSCLEGNVKMFIDGETSPSVNGTGTEDYFCGCFYYLSAHTAPYSLPFHGCPYLSEKKAQVSQYRFHIADPVPFEKSIRVQIEHGTQSRCLGDYSSVAYFYQTEPHAPFPPLEPVAQRLPREKPNIVFTPKDWDVGMDMYVNDKPGSTAECAFEGTGVRWLGFKFNKSGKVEVAIDGKAIEVFDQYDPRGNDEKKPTDWTPMPQVPFAREYKGLIAGKHTIKITVLAEINPHSGGNRVSLVTFEAIRDKPAGP